MTPDFARRATFKRSIGATDGEDAGVSPTSLFPLGAAEGRPARLPIVACQGIADMAGPAAYTVPVAGLKLAGEGDRRTGERPGPWQGRHAPLFPVVRVEKE
jgi:hypothetical protein